MNQDAIEARIWSHLNWNVDMNVTADGNSPGRRGPSHSSAVWPQLRELLARPDLEFVSGLYRILLGRPADELGLETHCAALRDGGDRVELIRAFATCPEAISKSLDISWLEQLEFAAPRDAVDELEHAWGQPSEAFVRGTFAALFRRYPDDAEAKGILGRLADGAPRAEIIRGLSQSEECSRQSIAPGLLDWLTQRGREEMEQLLSRLWGYSDHEFIRGLYHLLLNRPADSDGLVIRVAALNSGTSRLDIALGLLDSQEYKGSEDDAAWLRDFMQTLARQHESSLSTGDLSLPRVMSIANRAEFVRAAYLLAVGRPATESEIRKQRWLRGSFIRSRFLRHLMGSAEAKLYRHHQLTEQLARLARVGKDQALELESRMLTVSEKTRQNTKQAGEAMMTEVCRQFQSQQREAAQRLKLLQSAIRDCIDIQQASRSEMRAFSDAQRHEAQASSFSHDRQLNQIRRVLSDYTPPTAAPESQSLQLPVHPPCCRICESKRLSLKFKRQVLNGRYEARYFECDVCKALQIPDPGWLSEAYQGEDAPSLWEPDPGRFVRNFSACSWLKGLEKIGLLPPKGRVLDFGGGYGLLTRMLYDAGYDAWMWDPHIETPLFSPERAIADLDQVPDHSFDSVVAFEVFEHLTDPMQAARKLRRVLKPNGMFLLSTGLYNPQHHGEDWDYLSCEAGQHVTFWSREALIHFGRMLDFSSVGYWPGENGFCMVFTADPASVLRQKLRKANEVRQTPGYKEELTKLWDLAFTASVPTSENPQVDEIGPLEGGVSCAS